MQQGQPPTERTGLTPGLVSLRGYQKSWLRLDLLAGVTVAAYLIPQVMAYAQIAGLPPVVGMYAFCGAALAYAVFGSSRQLSVGPESTTALMTAAAVSGLHPDTPARYAAFAAAMAIVVGLLCVLGWLGRLGFLADLLSKPVLVGYMAGVALLMIISQIKKLTGISTSGDTLIEQVVSAVRNANQVQWPTLALSAGLLTLLLVGQRLFPKLPNPLIAVLVGTTVVAIFGLQKYGIAVVGSVSFGWPGFSLHELDLSLIGTMVFPALGIAVVGYSDNVLTARAFAKRGDNGAAGVAELNANQEFLALGAANIASGVFQGFPVSSSGSRTAIGDSMGSKTQLYSLVAMATMLIVAIFLPGLLASFPTAALGALVVYAALRLIEMGELRRIGRFRRSELALALATTASVLALGVLNGILVAIGLSLAELLRRVARPHVGILGYVPGMPGMHDRDDYPVVREVPGLVVFRYDSPLFFANADDFKRRALEAVDTASTPTLWFLLNCEAIVQVDLTSMDALAQLRAALQERNIICALARAKQELVHDLAAAGQLTAIGEDRIYPTLPTAVEAYLRWYHDRLGQLPHGMEIPPKQRDFLTETDDA